MEKFSYQLPTEFLTLPFKTPINLGVTYCLDKGKVLLLNIEVPPPAFAYIKDMYGLHDAIHKAAEAHATPMPIVDAMVKIYDHFKLPAQ